MRRLSFIFTLFLLIISVSDADAQRLIKKKLVTGTTLASNQVNRIFIPPPEEFLAKRGAKGGAKLDFYYSGFNSSTINAVEYAASILESILPDDVHITIVASWKRITESGVLANSTSTGYGVGWGIDAFLPWAIYPSALAEKISGTKLNTDSEGDIELNINSSVNWYLGLDGNTPTLRYDLVTVVLHELIHGIGFFDSFYGETSTGSYGTSSIPTIYDRFIENLSGAKLTDTIAFKNPSTELKAQITSGKIYFDGPVVNKYLGGSRAKIYSPAVYSSGSSISHLDEDTYEDIDGALMTPFIKRGEAIHNLGKLVRAMLGDIGWINTRIIHDPLPDTEEHLTSLVINAEIKSDTTYDRDKLRLFWSFDGFRTANSVFMTSPGSDNIFTATIPVSSYETRLDYFMEAEDYFKRSYLMPSDTSSPNSVYIGTDTVSPVILHTPVSLLFSTVDTIEFEALAADNIGIDTVYVEYKINDGLLKNEGMVHYDESEYRLSVNAKPLLINGGDSLQYRITAIDKSGSQNLKTVPRSGFFTAVFESINPVQDSYSTDFKNSAGDFITNGFTITKPAGFSNPGLHSRHPYESPEESGDSIGYFAVLRTPVRFDESGMIISFSEVVLVEPGEEGAAYGSPDFYDYVIVEGTRDFGKTWFSLADGYDSRYMDVWETAYNSIISGNNSTFPGDESLLVTHTIFPKASEKISAGDTMLVRFRLFSDPYANGWGWVIEDLHIGPMINSIEEIPSRQPVIFPNPGEGIITIRQDESLAYSSVKFSVFNITGTCLRKGFTEGAQDFNIDISSYPPGLYFIVLNHARGVSTMRYTLIK